MQLQEYPLNIKEKLEFNIVTNHVAKHCISLLGKTLAAQMDWKTNIQEIETLITEVDEFKNVIVNDSAFPDSAIPHIPGFVDSIRVEGSFLDKDECFAVLQVLILFRQVDAYFYKRTEIYPYLAKIFENNASNEQLIKSIERVIDKFGEIKSNASKDLQNIQSDLLGYEAAARKKIQSVYKKAKDLGWTADTEITVREGRLVIPILAEYKRKIKGFIHDESSTGQTVFIEPEEVLELNNEIRNLYLAYRREVRRILIALADELRPHLDHLIAYHNLLGYIDFVRAKALFALDIEAIRPEISTETLVNFRRAFHPLLFLHHKSINKEVKPLHIWLNEENRILVVSGPNAGGKSICLKTVGLLQYMFQSGMLVPLAEGSKMAVYERIFVDIGDEQSIENDLSTYSSHLKSMKHFVEFANGKTLFLIDEFGTGTDPHFGGPIAESILEHLNRKKAYGLVNTHYSNLKLYANKTEGIQNGSMGFDTDKLLPLYTLEIGNPGSSFAFEIARKIGLSNSVVQLAEEKVGRKQQDVDALLVNLEKDKNEVEKTKRLVAIKDQMLEDLIAKNENQLKEVNASKKAVLQAARLEAKAMLTRANQLVEATIRQIKENNANSAKTKAARDQLEAFKKSVENKFDTENFNEKYKLTSDLPIAKGDLVRLKESNIISKVDAIQRNIVVIVSGDAKLKVSIEDLERVEALPVKKEKEVKTVSRNAVQEHSAGTYLQRTLEDFSPKIDLRGMRTLEALDELEKLIDRALVLNTTHLTILHGRGDGILRKYIRDYLRKHKYIAHFESEHADLGGDGITKVELR